MKSKNILQFIYIFRADEFGCMNKTKRKETDLRPALFNRLGLRLGARQDCKNSICPFLKDPVVRAFREVSACHESRHSGRDFWKQQDGYIVLISIWGII
jgi:hypothetical protein